MAEWPKADKKKINKKLETSEELVSTTVADLSKIIKLVGREPKKITIIIADDWKAKMMMRSAVIPVKPVAVMARGTMAPLPFPISLTSVRKSKPHTTMGRLSLHRSSPPTKARACVSRGEKRAFQ